MVALRIIFKHIPVGTIKVISYTDIIYNKAVKSKKLESEFTPEGYGMNEMNEKMLDAIIKKAEALCPDSLALIGVYGSVITGDEYLMYLLRKFLFYFQISFIKCPKQEPQS